VSVVGAEVGPSVVADVGLSVGLELGICVVGVKLRSFADAPSAVKVQSASASTTRRSARSNDGILNNARGAFERETVVESWFKKKSKKVSIVRAYFQFAATRRNLEI